MTLTDSQREASAELAALVQVPAPPTRRFLDLPNGLHENVAPEIYHAKIAGVASKSVLDMIARAPAIYEAWLNGVEAEPNEALIFGSALHCAALEPERFSKEYAVEETWGDLRYKAAKDARDLWRREHLGATPLSAKDGSKIAGMVGALMAHPLAGPIVRDGRAEVTAKWIDQQTGLVCKSRADILHDHGFLADLKTTTDASAKAFGRTIANFRYHAQAAMYLHGFSEVGATVGQFLFVAIEKEPPYLVAVYALDDDAINRGHQLIRADINTLAGCVASGVYAGYPERIETLSLPPWA
jgi:hypothetical protein